MQISYREWNTLKNKNKSLELQVVPSGLQGISDGREKGHRATCYWVGSLEEAGPLNYEHA